MDNAPTEAPAEAPKAPESEATPTTSTEQTQSSDMYGFTSEQLAEMKKFYDANGGFDKVKSRISNPQQFEQQPQQQQMQQPNYGPQAQPNPTSQQLNQPQEQYQPEPTYQIPRGAITPQEFLAEQYFKSLAGEEKYANIADGVRNGDYLKEMSAFGIQALNPDGSINDQKVRMYLDLKSQTVPAKPTESTPSASAAPTVTYTEVGENGIANIDQAYKILMEPNNPAQAKAEEFIKNSFNKK